MSQPQVIILAAGQSTRLHPLTLDCPKALLPFGKEPLLLRTLRQLHTAGFTDIYIVVGHLQHLIKEAVKQLYPATQFIHNEHYAADTNSLSLHLGLANLTSRALIIEADVVFPDACWPIISKACAESPSVWFTQGLFQPDQVGGIIKSNAEKCIIDMRLVSRFATQYADYSKNLGVVYIGEQEFAYYKSILANAVATSLQAYYMEHWITHLPQLACQEINLFPHPVGSFNTLQELITCRNRLFHSEVT